MPEVDEQPRFSIVVPAFNEARYLGAALDSLQGQDFSGAYEIIVVDNNSTDGTAEIATSHGVTVLHELEPGVCSARQRGTAAARGHIVVSTDADTIYPLDWLSRIDARFASLDGVVAVAGPCRYETTSRWVSTFPTLMFGAVARVNALTGRVYYVSATNIAFVRTAFSGYNTTLTQGGDEFDLIRRLRRRGTVIWDRDNVVTTSSRRFQRGFVYHVVVSFMIQYLLAYALNKLLARRVLGMAPALRYERVHRPKAAPERIRSRFWGSRWRLGLSLALVATTSFGVFRYAVPGVARLLGGP